MRFSAHSIPKRDPTESSASSEETMLVHGLAEAILKSPDSTLRQYGLDDRSSSPNYPAFLQPDSDISDEDAGDIPYRNDGEDKISVEDTNRMKPSVEEDPGPSVRFRTAAELEAAIEAQVEDTSISGLDTTGLPLLRNFLTSFDMRLRDLHPERTELDWRKQRRPTRSAVSRRAAQGQLCGVEAPADQACTNCTQERGTFKHCRIVFVDNEAQWTWACANCIFVSGGHKCSFRPDISPNVPSWVVAAVTERQPSSPLLQKYYGKKDTATAHQSAKSTTSRKRSTAVAQLTPEQIDQASDLETHEHVASRHEPHSPTIQRAKRTARVSRNTVSKGTAPKYSYEEKPAKRRKSEICPTKASGCVTKNVLKRCKSEVGPSTASKCANKGATPPKLKNGGLSFNATWYSSPLEDPEVYRMKDKAYAIDTFNDIADIMARVKEDHSRMKEALLKKGFLPGSEEENVFAVV
ncbi:uncharacterized protein N7479_002948 [Penicillium vulpinum]|uniref:Uncharacterized protein n=1 Tax=Penicillium vulpinum TaxID=29845 RepID=A0A1V6RDV0_9EURO|nr:uncharacterized protein N7479_002948 [Penicillium vulpinum]KAJ5973030.1 hypothetical protein N7479_002948 [Penicillium vulpinum]OQD99730.1 hypothetical protein PENVUL_c061G06682 [Penicillium vulpinum]